MLNHSTVTPLYQQIVDIMKKQILSGEFKPGQMLPSEAKLCEIYGVSRITARNAIQILADEGMVIKKHGKGSFVADNLSRSSLNKFRGFTTICIENNIAVYSHVISMERMPASPELASELKLAAGEPVIYIRRLRLANYKPVIIEHAYFPYGRFAFLLNEDLENNSLYSVIKKSSGFDIEVSCENSIELSASIANKEEAELLGIKAGTPLFVMKERVYDNTGRPVHVTKQIMLGNAFRFMLSTPENRLMIELDK